MPGRTRHRLIAAGGVAALVAAGVVVASGAAHHDRQVHLSIDGATRTVSTDDDTVSAVLDQAGVTVDSHDAVVPSLASAVPASDLIVVHHGRPVSLTLDQQPATTVWTTAISVGQLLAEQGLVRSGSYLSDPMTAPLPAALTVRLPQHVTVVHDGTTRVLTTTAPTVAALLRGAHVTAGAHDTVQPAATTYPLTGTTVQVVRRSTETVGEDVTLPVTTSRIVVAGLAAGTSTLVRAGTAGTAHRTYAVSYRDGQVVSRQLLSSTVVTAMVPRILHVGPTPVASVPVASSGGLNWAALARCESGGNPRAVGGGGLYFGLYQFSLGTWAGVGGTGNPIDASPAEQTARAEILYARSGASSWPVCGRNL